jgi:hypothetical protein
MLRNSRELLILSSGNPVYLASLNSPTIKSTGANSTTKMPRFPHRSYHKGKAKKLRRGFLLPHMVSRAELERLISSSPTAATKQRAPLSTIQGCNNMVVPHYHSLISRMWRPSHSYPSSTDFLYPFQPRTQGYLGQHQPRMFGVDTI